MLVETLRQIIADIEEIKTRTDIDSFQKEKLAMEAALSLPDRLKAQEEPSKGNPS